MNRQIINIGDLVEVRWEYIKGLLRVRVIGKPQDVGDCWQLYDEENDIPYNVQMFGKMKLIERKEVENE